MQCLGLLVCLLASACKTSDNNNVAAVVDAACAKPFACTLEDNEDCAACFDAVGRCCYGDPDWGSNPGTRDVLVARCNALPTCRACCNECSQFDCPTMKRRGLCPNLGVVPDAGP
jgi:hypothetical protein